jgi:hypothetical protein
MYVNGKTVGMGRIKENDGGAQFNYDTLDIL